MVQRAAPLSAAPSEPVADWHRESRGTWAALLRKKSAPRCRAVLRG